MVTTIVSGAPLVAVKQSQIHTDLKKVKNSNDPTVYTCTVNLRHKNIKVDNWLASIWEQIWRIMEGFFLLFIFYHTYCLRIFYFNKTCFSTEVMFEYTKMTGLTTECNFLGIMM